MIGCYYNPFYNRRCYFLVIGETGSHYKVMILTSGMYIQKGDPIFETFWKPGTKTIISKSVSWLI